MARIEILLFLICLSLPPILGLSKDFESRVWKAIDKLEKDNKELKMEVEELKVHL